MSNQPYELTQDDRQAADRQAVRIASDLAGLSVGSLEFQRIAAAKIEAAILAEMAMRGEPLAKRR